MMGKEPSYMTREIDDKIVRMFNMTDRVWFDIERDRRRYFLNYYYILFKLLELIGQTELLPQVPLLRIHLRLRQLDVLWKRMCDELGWTSKQTDMAYTSQSVTLRQGTYKRKPKAPIDLRHLCQ